MSTRTVYRVLGLCLGTCGLLSAVLGIGLYIDIQHAEAGQPNILPLYVRNSLADMLYEKAKHESDVTRRINGMNEVVNLNPRYRSAWRYLCSSYQSVKQWDQAASACRRSSQFEPSAIAYEALGKALQNAKDYAGAAAAYGDAEKLIPYDSIYVGELYWTSLVAGKYDQVVSVGNHYLDLEHRYFPELEENDIYRGIGFAYSQLGEDKQARVAFSHAFPSWTNVSCTMSEKYHGEMALDCSGVDRNSGRETGSCWADGFGCLDKIPPELTANESESDAAEAHDTSRSNH